MDEACPTVVFISHNTNQKETASEEGKNFLAGLVSALDGRNFVTLVDSKLPKGEQWRSVLYSWMHHCDCAVMLLDEHSEKSRWVPREAMVFSWRRVFDPSFKLFILLRCDDKEIFNRPPYQEMALGEFTYFKEIEELIEGLEKLNRPAPDPHLTKLEELLGISAGKDRQPRNVVQEVRKVLGLQGRGTFVYGMNSGRQIAAALLAFGLRREPFPASVRFPSVVALKQFSIFITHQDLLQSFRLLFPGWVDRRDVAAFYGASTQGTKGVIAMRLHVDESTWPECFFESYCLEAYSRKSDPIVRWAKVSAAASQDMEDDRLVATRKFIHDALWKRILGKLNEPHVGHLKTVLENMGPVFLWTTQDDNLRPQDLVAVQAELPAVRIFYLYREPPPVAEVEGVCYLETGLSEEADWAANAEQAAHIAIDSSRALLEI